MQTFLQYNKGVPVHLQSQLMNHFTHQGALPKSHSINHAPASYPTQHTQSRDVSNPEFGRAVVPQEVQLSPIQHIIRPKQAATASPVLSNHSSPPSALNYLSSTDSGHWSCGSNPPSPIPRIYHLNEDTLVQQAASFASVWRPW